MATPKHLANVNSQQYFVFLKDLFNRFIHSSWQCVCAHESRLSEDDSTRGIMNPAFNGGYAPPHDVELVTNSCMSSVSTETAGDGWNESGISKEEWEVYASQCVVKGNNHITWLFPQYFSYMKVDPRALRHV